MTPYKIGKKAWVDPTIKDFHYGKLAKDYISQTGKIVATSYSDIKKTMTYQIEYEDGYKAWFLESEII